MIFEAGIAIYVAMAVALAVWIGIFVYLWRIDAQVRRMRRQLDRRPEPDHAAKPTATLRVQPQTPPVGRQATELADTE